MSSGGRLQPVEDLVLMVNFRLGSVRVDSPSGGQRYSQASGRSWWAGDGPRRTHSFLGEPSHRPETPSPLPVLGHATDGARKLGICADILFWGWALFLTGPPEPTGAMAQGPQGAPERWPPRQAGPEVFVAQAGWWEELSKPRGRARVCAGMCVCTTSRTPSRGASRSWAGQRRGSTGVR